LDRSPGYALTLLAESTTSAIYSAEAVSRPGVPPEDIGLEATYALLNEIERGGCVDEKHQTLVLLMMVLGSEDVGRCLMSEPTTRTYVFSVWPCIPFVPDLLPAFNFCAM
jgi:RNA 3'-terminal phosphate cyclase-like protein